MFLNVRSAVQRVVLSTAIAALAIPSTLHAHLLSVKDARTLLLSAGPTIQAERLLTTVLPDSPINATPRGAGFDAWPN